MSYSSINKCANDQAFMARLTACAAQEGAANPEYIMSMFLRWPVSSKTDIEAAYEYALNAENPDPGGDATVVTDQQILSAVQDVMADVPLPQPPEPEPPA